MSAVAVVAVVAVVAAYVLHQIDPGGRLGRKVTVAVPAGSSVATIGRRLAAAGVIHDAAIFGIYARLEGFTNLQAGTYHLATNESYSEAVAALQAGPALVVDKLVIPEGFTLRQIAARIVALPGMHTSVAAVEALSSSGAVRSPYEPAGVNDLEGLLFPATYDVTVGESPQLVLTQMVQAFDQRAAIAGLPQAAAALGISVYQLVTVASIVQAEAKLDSDRPDVASVLYNRLRAGIPLGADSTLIYALRRDNPNLDLATVDYQAPSPYNTRIHTGLPPTPIGNPGLPSLDAAARPPATNLLYFVEVNPDGALGFASSAAGFAQLQAQCVAAKLC